MINRGIIQKIEGDIVTVLAYKSAGCGGCKGCGDSGKYTNEFEFKTNKPFEIGEEVEIEVKDKEVLKLGLVIYVIPILFLFLGYFIGVKVFKTEGKAVLVSFVFVIISGAFIFMYDKINGKKLESKMEIRKPKEKFESKCEIK